MTKQKVLRTAKMIAAVMLAMAAILELSERI